MPLPLSRGLQMTRAEEAFATSSAPADEQSIDLRDRIGDGLGHQLTQARQRCGMSLADVAGRLRLPLRLVERIEADDYAGISDGVFLRGYLASYARLVGVPVDFATRVADANAKVAPLVATGTISRTRYLFERYSVGATYLVLTAIIVVPAVWLATHGGLEQNFVRTAPLDPPARITATVSTPPDASSVAATEPAQTGAEASQMPAETSPVVASMTPFQVAQPPAEAPAAMVDVGSGRAIVLKLAEQSWVEIAAADGRRVEYGMLAAGSEHAYHADGPLSIRIGNAQGASLSIDGRTLDIAPYQRGNVAHFKLLADGTPGRADRVDQ